MLNEQEREAVIAELEAHERGEWVGPHKAVVGLPAHKALKLDEDARVRSATRFAGTPAERKAIDEAAEAQRAQQRHARASEEKGRRR